MPGAVDRSESGRTENVCRADDSPRHGYTVEACLHAREPFAREQTASSNRIAITGLSKRPRTREHRVPHVRSPNVGRRKNEWCCDVAALSETSRDSNERRRNNGYDDEPPHPSHGTTMTDGLSHGTRRSASFDLNQGPVVSW